MRIGILLVICCLLLAITISQKCERNRFEFMSSYVLGRQQDLTQTFKIIQKNISISEVIYKDEVFRSYRIFNFKPMFYFAQSKQKVEIRPLNILRVSGGTLRLSYTFQWEKKQLSESVLGTAIGTVTSDPITFEKTLQTNQKHQLIWVLTKVIPISLSNSLKISNVTPYKANDSQILQQMLNGLKTNETTVKIRLIQALNKDLESILRAIVLNDTTWNVDRVIDYSYFDYRGNFSVSFDNILGNVSLKSDGLSMSLSQQIQNYSQFECGEAVPNQPVDVKIFGGHQQFMSNSLLKSTLRYALQKGFLDVILSNDNWQSRAFQFYMGDIHDVMPTTKNISTLIEVNGRCNALNDSAFNLKSKTDDSYQVTVNFTCYINYTNIKLLGMNLLVNYTVKPTLYPRYIDFVVTQIEGTPEFFEEEKFKIANKPLALFMVAQILNTVKDCKVLGSGYRISTRKYPNIWVRDKYLVMYDSAMKPKVDQQL